MDHRIGRTARTSSLCDKFATPSVAPPVPWDRPRDATRLLENAARDYAGWGPNNWSVIWAAGAAVVGTSETSASAELDQFHSTILAIKRHLPQGRGVFFLSSSAGGVYAGSAGPPFDETSVPSPISPYGRLKLDMERLTVELLGGFCKVVIGRFSNLYGPGQNLKKSQGLISQLCVHTLTRKALNIYVPLETLRDHLYVDDAATLTLAATRAATAGTADPIVRVLASHEPATVARLIDLINRQSHHRPLISVGVNRDAFFQVRDLRLRSRYAEEQQALRRTTLSVGVAKVFRSTAELLRAGAFAHSRDPGAG